ncbi:unnamed protein product [Arctogadus glacialis]
MMEDLMMEWADKVWRGRPGAFFRPSAGLVMDSISAHLTPKVKSHFKLKTNLSEAGRHSRVYTIREDEEGDVCRSELLVPSCLGQVDTETIVNSFGKTLFGPESDKAEGDS